MLQSKSMIILNLIKHEDLIFDNKLSYFENEKHQTRVSLLLELVIDAYLTENRTGDLYSSTQVIIPLDHRRLQVLNTVYYSIIHFIQNSTREQKTTGA